MKNKRVFGIALTLILLLLLPLIAMQFTNEVNWKVFDFAVAGFLLLICGIVFEVTFRKVPRTKQRIAIIAIILLALFIIWAELAVGIFGTPFAGS